jgi:hypothetical protein
MLREKKKKIFSYAIYVSYKWLLYYLLVFLQPNGHDHGTEAVAERMLAVAKDHIEVNYLMHSLI